MKRAGGFSGAWGHRRWRWLLGSFAVSTTGDFLYFVAILVFLIERTGSTSWVAASAVVRILAYVVLGPFGGAIADRYDRRRLMITLDLIRAANMAVIAAIVWADGPVIAVVALTIVNSAASVPFRPAAIAATPVLVAEDDLAAANAAESVVSQVALFAGPAIGAAIVAVSNPGTGFAVNGLTFLLSAALLVRVGDVGGRRAGVSEADSERVASGLLAEIAEGGRIVRTSPGLLALLAAISSVVFLLGVEEVVEVLVVRDRLDSGTSGVGLLAAAVGIGGLVIAPFTARLGAGRNSGALFAGSVVVFGLPFALFAVVSSMPVALVLSGIQGVAGLVFEVLFITTLQRCTPPAALARVFGLMDSVTAAAQLVGSVVAPLLVSVLDLEGALWATGGLVVAAGLLLWPALHRSAVIADDERRRLAPVADRLRRLGIFGDASQASLERLARSARSRQITAGGIVFEEGDSADDLFVIESGTAVVSTAAQGEVNRMGPDEWFGEIGLLHAIPRTATVTATTDVELLAISGEVFLEALNGAQLLPDPLRLMMVSRAARTGTELPIPGS